MKIFRRLLSGNIIASFALGYLIIIILLAVFAPYVAPYNPKSSDLSNRFSPPDTSHPFGTDSLGRDVLSRVIYGSRVSLAVGFVSTGIALFIGVILGLVAGYYGGLIDEVIMRVCDIFLTLPWLPLVLIFVAIFGSNLTNIYVIFGITWWTEITRVIRPESKSLTQRDFIMAEKSMGASAWRIIFRHLLPNQIPAIIVLTSLMLGWTILGMSTVGFLGLAPITIDWGSDLSQSLKFILKGSWWLVFFPGLAIFLTCLCFYLMSDVLQDFFNIRMRR
jgi:peptide/nickel transport system permease protein